MITRRGIGGASLQDTRFVSFSVPQTPRPEQTVGGKSTNMLVCFGVLVQRVREASTAQVREPVRKPKNDGTLSTQDRPRSIIYQLADLPRVTCLLDWIGLKRRVPPAAALKRPTPALISPTRRHCRPYQLPAAEQLCNTETMRTHISIKHGCVLGIILDRVR